MEKRLMKLRITKKNGDVNYWNPLTYVFLLIAVPFVIGMVIWLHFYPINPNELK